MKHEHIIITIACLITLFFFAAIMGITLLINLLIKNVWISILITLPVAVMIFNCICKIIDRHNIKKYERKYKKNILQ